MKKVLDILSYIIVAIGLGSLFVGLGYVFYSKWSELCAISLYDWLSAGGIAALLFVVFLTFIASMTRIMNK